MKEQQCWCGSKLSEQFSEYYYRCDHCNTLVSGAKKTDEYYKGSDSGESLYGKDYWLKHVIDLGTPDINGRARNDLIERDIHWMRDILKYRLPPGKTLEFGCCHGGSVYLMRLAGFDASGAEMSPWLCEYAREKFNVPMYCGSIKDVDVEQGSLDVVIMMDVLEHLLDPAEDMKRIARLLKDDGLVFIQTPCIHGLERSYEQMKHDSEMFLLHLKEDEHLFLFNKSSVESLLNQAGFPFVSVEPAIFPHDMFVVGGKQKLVTHSVEDVDAHLLKSPEGRVALGMIDLYNRQLLLEKECVATKPVDFSDVVTEEVPDGVVRKLIRKITGR